MKNSHFAKKLGILAGIVVLAFILLPLSKAKAETQDETATVTVSTDNNHADPDCDCGGGNPGGTVGNGNIQFHALLCPAGTVLVSSNEPDSLGLFATPDGCVPESGVLLGYIHENIDNRWTTPYLGLETGTPFTVIGATDATGMVTLANVPIGGRYDVAEVNADGSWATSAHTIKLSCYGDSTNPDNYEMVLFTSAGQTVSCVDYNATSTTPATPPTPPGGGGGTPSYTACDVNHDGVVNIDDYSITDQLIAQGLPHEEAPNCSTGGGSNNGGGGSISVGGGNAYFGTGGTSTGTTTGEVLGATTPGDSCDALINSYIKPGANNDYSDVIKLQLFLNRYENANLIYTGLYDSFSIDAVNAYQLKYSDQVLKPWFDLGLLPTSTTTTSYVYKTTRRMMNNEMCSTLNLPIPPLP